MTHKKDAGERSYVQTHKFPEDPKLKLIWLNRIPHKVSLKEITENWRVCEKHFSPLITSLKALITKKRRVKKRDSLLKHKKLKDNAVQSIWPGLTAHLTKPPLKPCRTSLACSEARLENVEAMEKKEKKI